MVDVVVEKVVCVGAHRASGHVAVVVQSWVLDLLGLLDYDPVTSGDVDNNLLDPSVSTETFRQLGFFGSRAFSCIAHSLELLASVGLVPVFDVAVAELVASIGAPVRVRRLKGRLLKGKSIHKRQTR